MKVLVEDVIVGNRLLITEELFNIMHIEDKFLNDELDRRMIGEELLILDTFDVNGEGIGFIINYGLVEHYFTKSCGTYLEITNQMI